jgi:hypothetical protein
VTTPFVLWMYLGTQISAGGPFDTLEQCDSTARHWMRSVQALMDRRHRPHAAMWTCNVYPNRREALYAMTKDAS